MIWRFRGLISHLFSQLIYIYLSFSLFALKREWTWFAATLVLSVCLYALTRALNRVKTTYKIEWIISALAIGNSVMLNMEGHGPAPYLLATIVGILAMSIFRGEHSHIFNPSAIGVFAVAMLWSDKASFASWSQTEWLPLVVLCLGTLTSCLAGRWRTSYGYILGFILASFAMFYTHKLLGTPSYKIIKPFFWPLTLLDAGSLIFIFHVISDPKTGPKTQQGQWIFGAGIGALDICLRGFSFLPALFVSYLLMQVLNGLMPNIFDGSGEAISLSLKKSSIWVGLSVWSKRLKQAIVIIFQYRPVRYVLIFGIGLAVGVLFLSSYLRGRHDSRIAIRVTPSEMNFILQGMNENLIDLSHLLEAAAKNDTDEVVRTLNRGSSNYMAKGLPYIAQYMPKEFRALASASHGAFSALQRDVVNKHITLDQVPMGVANIQRKCLNCHEKYRYEYEWSLRGN